MKADPWTKIELLIEQALALPAEERTGFLEIECGDDVNLKNEIESLLIYSDKIDGVLKDITENVIPPTIEELLASRFQNTDDDELQIIGKNIAHYQIEEKLGNGGMGVVYKARDNKLNRTVALKFLIPKFNPTDENKQYLIPEAQAAAALNHPNICTIHQINEYEGKQFIVMEFIDGKTMREKLSITDVNSDLQEYRISKLNIETAIDYSLQIAEALQEAHEKEIIHRDIKPENIMVDSKNRIKVTDFGLAKLIGSTDLEKVRAALGTLAYMSPEQIQRGAVDHRSDIFSFGIVLYEMLTGSHPFRNVSESDTIHAILKKDPAPFSELLPQISTELTDLISRMLEKDPDDRYQSIHDLIIDLKNYSELIQVSNDTINTSPYSFRFRTKMVYLTAILALFVFAGYLFLLPRSGPSIENLNNSIAVLALDNLSPDPDDVYFADVIHEEIISLLSGISSLTVISRSSVLGYPAEERDFQQIGRDLGVSTVMEGTVQRTGERLYVSMQLFDTENLATLWSDSFEDYIDNIYDIQSLITREVAEALGTTLTSDEHQRMDKQPTENSKAYDFYMRAREYSSRTEILRDHYLNSELLLNRAIEEDPFFAHAYALLAITYSNIYWYFGHTPERLQQIKEAAEQAKLLNPNLPETHLALGLYYYWSDTDQKKSLSHFESALQQVPNHTQLNIYMGLIHRRAGNWQLAEDHLKKALNLDPRNFTHHLELAWLYIWIREYDKAESIVKRQIDLFPELPLYMYKAFISYHRDGSFEGFNTWREMRPEMVELENYFFGNFNYYNRDWESALHAYQSIETEIAVDTDNDYIPKLYLIARALQAQGDSVTPFNYYEQVRIQIEELRDNDPNDPRFRTILGKVYAVIGETDKAVGEGKTATNLVSYDKDAFRGAWFALDLAEIYTLSGDYEEAIELLEFLLSVPGFVSKNDLRLSPKWDPLRYHPKFHKLTEL